MANAEKGEVALKVGEDEFTLVFSIDALCQLEEKAGKPISAIVSEMSDPDTRSVRLLRLMLWAALREKHPKVTVLQAGQLIVPAGGVDGVLPLVFNSFALSFPSSNGGGDSESPPERPSQQPGSAD